MNTWLDLALVVTIVLASAMYAIYALGPKRIRDTYTRFATKYFGLRAVRWFAPSTSGAHSCRDCPAHSDAAHSGPVNKRL
ncbi:MAG: hypothetical protein H7Y02_08540 [Candidatus Obscuribacterales bacterium]|nr:hypothetical protein [Steroidobacteraceae bacterium]